MAMWWWVGSGSGCLPGAPDRRRSDGGGDRPRGRVTSRGGGRAFSALARIAAAGLALATALAVTRWGSALGLAAAVALPTAGGWLGPVLHQTVAREEILVDAPGQQLEADLYRPARPRRALLLVHGLSPAGRRHPELMRLAALLAAHGQLVLVPHFPGLAGFRLDGREVEQVRAGLRHLTEAALPLGVGGFSFGAGPAVIAASAMPEVALAASFGGYADLRNVIVFVTTGTHSFQDHRERRPHEEYNRWKLLALLAGFVADARDRERLDRIAQRRLEDPGQDTSAAESALGEGARAMLMLVRARREDEVRDRLARLPVSVQTALEELSAVRAVPRLAGRLLIAHGADDASIPFTEGLLLANAAGRRARVAILSGFHHAGPLAGWGALRLLAIDGWRLWTLAEGLLGD
jgi:hypothetical protein